MCGLAGFIPSSNIDASQLKNIASSMSQTLIHRGPDASGCWVDTSKKLALSFRRLSIQDLSESGNQPMQSSSKRFTIVFNGEIYNHLDLRRTLDSHFDQKYIWTGSSDTETILQAFEYWGIQNTLNQLNGMFAMAIYDSHLNILTLARDRMGEKPLYFGIVDGSFVFASELKAIKKFPRFNNPICRVSIAKYLQYNFIPAPLSIYEDIYKLNPGSTIDINIFSQTFAPLKQKIFWQISDIAMSSKSQIDEETALFSLEDTLKNVISKQMISDVPLGAFLSGGVDSSLVVSLMQEISIKPVKTFTIGFEEDEFNESHHARLVAQHLNTDHTEVILDSKTAHDVIFDLPHIYDEPFADSSQIPSFLISQLAKKDVTVALTGDGGDEIFGGYNRYLWAPSIWKNISKIPFSLRPFIFNLINNIPRLAIPILQSLINLAQSRAGSIDSLENKLQKIAKVLLSSSQKDFYIDLISHWKNPENLVNGLKKEDLIFLDSSFKFFPENQTYSEDFVTSMMQVDSSFYLPGDILCKVDRASMANSLETRAPFLDHDLIKLAYKLPTPLRIDGREGKRALREILYKYVPREIIERPKTGFSIPIADWLRGPLRDWAEELLSTSRINSEGYLNSKLIQVLWRQHLSGRYDWSDRLWGILMFQSWLEDN